MRVRYAIVHVTDMRRSVAFYRDTLGIGLRFESPGWAEFATEGATLALHAGGIAASGGGRCQPGFAVTDLDAFHVSMQRQGVRCVEPPRSVFGARVARYADPDGLEFSVGEDART